MIVKWITLVLLGMAMFAWAEDEPLPFDTQMPIKHRILSPQKETPVVSAPVKRVKVVVRDKKGRKKIIWQAQGQSSVKKGKRSNSVHKKLVKRTNQGIKKAYKPKASGKFKEKSRSKR